MLDAGKTKVDMPNVYSLITVNSDSLINNPASFNKIQGEFNFDEIFRDKLETDDLRWLQNFLRRVIRQNNDRASMERADGDGENFSRYLFDSLKSVEPAKRMTFLKAMIEHRFDGYSFSYAGESGERLATDRHLRLKHLFYAVPSLRHPNFERLLREDERTWLSFNCKIDSAYYLNFLLSEIVRRLSLRQKGREVVFIIPDHPIFAELAFLLETIGDASGFYLICNQAVDVFYHLDLSER